MIKNQNDPKVRAWRVSSRSTGGNQCVEIGALSSGEGVAIRDSKNPSGPAHVLTRHQWATFLTALKR